MILLPANVHFSEVGHFTPQLGVVADCSGERKRGKMGRFNACAKNGLGAAGLPCPLFRPSSWPLSRRWHLAAGTPLVFAALYFGRSYLIAAGLVGGLLKRDFFSGSQLLAYPARRT